MDLENGQTKEVASIEKREAERLLISISKTESFPRGSRILKRASELLFEEGRKGSREWPLTQLKRQPRGQGSPKT